MTSFSKYSCKHAIKRIVLHAMILLLRQGKTGQLNRKEEKMEIKEEKVGLVPKHTARQPHTLALFLLYNLAPLTPPNTSRTFSVHTGTPTLFFPHLPPTHSFCRQKVTRLSWWDEMKLFWDTTIFFTACTSHLTVSSLYSNSSSNHPTPHSFPLNATVTMTESNPKKKPTTVTTNAQKKSSKPAQTPVFPCYKISVDNFV